VKGFRLLQHYLINPICGASEKNIEISIDKIPTTTTTHKNQSKERKKKTITSLIIFMKLYFLCVFFS